ncbi:MAG: glycosyltransferase [Candidatus Micrarchaeota archaeon]|nr:glycosyltransferase [Candidatus Micrarchaeota archaeon]
MPKISVVIPALNEEKYIRYAFEGLRGQSFRDFEVIVSDAGSKDRTREIARKYGARVVIERKRGISSGRNAGARIAKGKILVFIDADTRATRDVLKIYSKALGNGVVAATGPILPLEKTNLLMQLGYLFVSEIFVKLSIALGMPSIVGSNFAITKKSFDAINGFNENLITYEDWDLSTRVKKLGKIDFLEDAIVYASVRRVKAWGIGHYFTFHVGNMFRYKFFKRSKDSYDPIR